MIPHPDNQQINRLLEEERIPWRRIRALGGDIEEIARRARLGGDEDLYRRARRAVGRSA